MEAVAKKELTWLKAHAKPRFPFERAYPEATNYQKSAPERYIETLEKYLKIVPYLIPKDKGLQRPILGHPDLQPNNIFVSKVEIIGLSTGNTVPPFPSSLQREFHIIFRTTTIRNHFASPHPNYLITLIK
jgi:hypothetical protein